MEPRKALHWKVQVITEMPGDGSFQQSGRAPNSAAVSKHAKRSLPIFHGPSPTPPPWRSESNCQAQLHGERFQQCGTPEARNLKRPPALTKI